jgi:dihydroorotate dehydrogenase (fumarate)
MPVDLTTNYLGLKLKHPLVPSAGPLSHTLDSMKRLEDAGAAAVVMYSLFEEQIAHDGSQMHHYLSSGTDSYAEALTYFPGRDDYNLGPEEYVDLVRRAKESLDIPVIGSLNGISPGGWTSYAKKIEEAGADALELNVYYISTDPERTSDRVERGYIDLLRTVKKSLRIPVAVKLGPFFSAFANIARRLDDAGADGLVLFNRFYQPDLDIETLEVVPNLILSSPATLRLPLRWVAILAGRIRASLAASGGIHTGADAIKAVMAGADVAMMCAALLKRGHAHVGVVLEEMVRWMEEHEYESVAQMKGSMSQRSVPDPASFERANYVKTLQQFRPLREDIP